MSKSSAKRWWIGVIGLLLTLFLLTQIPIAWLLSLQAEDSRFRLTDATGNISQGSGTWQFTSHGDDGEVRSLAGQVDWRLSVMGLLATRPYQVTVTQGGSTLAGQASFNGSRVRLYDWSGQIAPDSLQAGLGLNLDQPVQIQALSGIMADAPLLTGQASLAPATMHHRMAGITGRVKLPALTADIAPMADAQGTDIQINAPSGRVATVAWTAENIQIGVMYRLIKEMTGMKVNLVDDDKVVLEINR